MDDIDIGVDFLLKLELIFLWLCYRRNKFPGPDPLYIDQAKAVLLQLNSLDLSQMCKQR